MTRTEGFQKMLEEANKERTSRDEWNLLLLIDIAYSLAVIADEMRKGANDEIN